MAVPYTEKDVPSTASKRVIMNTSKEDNTTEPNAPAKSKPTSASTPKKVLPTKGANYASAGETPKTVTQSYAVPSTSKGFAAGDKVKIKKKGLYHDKTGVICPSTGKQYKVKLDDGSIVPSGTGDFYSKSLEKL